MSTPADPSVDVIGQLTRARTARGLSQTELAAQLGMTQPALSRLESPSSDPKLSTLQRWAGALACEVTVQPSGAGAAAGDGGLLGGGDGSQWLYMAAPPSGFGALGDVVAPGGDVVRALLADVALVGPRRRSRPVHVLWHHDPDDPSAHVALVGVRVLENEVDVLRGTFARFGFTAPPATMFAAASTWCAGLGSELVEFSTQLRSGSETWTASILAAAPQSQVTPGEWVVDLAATVRTRLVVSARGDLVAGRGGHVRLCDASVVVAARAPELPVRIGGVALRCAEGAQGPAVVSTVPGSTSEVVATGVELPLAVVPLCAPQAAGDAAGVVIGLAEPTLAAVRFDPCAATAGNRAPITAVTGAPGFGKSHLTAVLCASAERSVLVNTKDSQNPPAEFTAAADELVAGPDTPGMFDPFRWMPAPAAAEICIELLLSVSSGLNEAEELDVRAGALKAGALKVAAGSARELLRGLLDAGGGAEEFARRSLEAIKGTALLGLVFDFDGPGDPPVLAPHTVVSFAGLQLPDPRTQWVDMRRVERISVGVLEVACRCLLANVAAAAPGSAVLAVDDLGPLRNTGFLYRVEREARSLGVEVVLATPAPEDFVEADVSPARVFAGFERGERGAAAALHLCGLPATRENLEWIMGAGSSTGSERVALKLHRDLQGRVAPVVVRPDLPGITAPASPLAPGTSVAAGFGEDPGGTAGGGIGEERSSGPSRAHLEVGETYDVTLSDGVRLEGRTVSALTATPDASGAPTRHVQVVLHTPYGVTETMPLTAIRAATPLE